MDRKERVKAVNDLIKQHHNSSENSFQMLYTKLLEEIDLEMAFNSDLRKNSYLNNLRQTRDKQADTYMKIKARRPKKGAPNEYKGFVSNFMSDTLWAAHRD